MLKTLTCWAGRFILAAILASSAATGPATGPTDGFAEQKLTFKVQHPYDLKESDRYSEDHGVYHLWVRNTDKPFAEGNKTLPRTEMRFPDYTSPAIVQFEADMKVPPGTNNVCICQIHTSNEESSKFGATTYMIDVRDNGELRFHNDTVLLRDIYDKWFHLNVIHDTGKHTIECYVNGKLADSRSDNKATSFYFKCGVYEQRGGSDEMHVYVKNVKLWTKS